MKRVLITGENSYIGTSVAKWLEKSPDEFEVTTISVRGEEWKKHDFSQYDCMIHVAGLVHIKETKKSKKKYYDINYTLTKELAIKAKKSKIKKFVFFSSMSIFGVSNGVIDENTIPNPKNEYGKTKLMAELFLETLVSQEFKLAIIRPPMVYGNKCSGNYAALSNFSKKTIVFPVINNQRSMIFIDNLSELVRNLIINEKTGTFHPQNKEYVCTTDLVKKIASINNHKIYFTKILNPLFNLFSFKILNKIFGDLVYSKKISESCYVDGFIGFEESIQISEGVAK